MQKLVATFLVISSLLLPSLIALADDTSPYDLHAAYALTGVAAPFGAADLNGTTLAIDEFNHTDNIDGKKVRMIVEDTQSTNVQSLNAVRKLISVNKAKIILGPTWLDSFQSALPIADREKVMLLTPSATIEVVKRSDAQYPFVFSTYFNLELGIDLLLKHVKNEQRKRIILAFDQDLYFQTFRSMIRSKAASLGIEIVADESFDLNAADFRTMLIKTMKLNADGAIFGFGDEKNLLTFLKQRKELNPSLPLFGDIYLDGYVSQAQWLHLLENVDFLSMRVRDNNFAAKFEKRFKAQPVLSASTAYDAATILLQALKANKRAPAEIRDYLLSNEFNTVTFGKVKFNSLGGVQSSDFEIKKVRNQEIIRELIS